MIRIITGCDAELAQWLGERLQMPLGAGAVLGFAGVGQICMGEVRGRAPENFDFGNSPFEVSAIDFQGKTVVQRTSAGYAGDR